MIKLKELLETGKTYVYNGPDYKAINANVALSLGVLDDRKEPFEIFLYSLPKNEDGDIYMDNIEQKYCTSISYTIAAGTKFRVEGQNNETIKILILISNNKPLFSTTMFLTTPIFNQAFYDNCNECESFI